MTIFNSYVELPEGNYGYISMINDNLLYWLVVLTPLNNMSQVGSLFPIYGEKKCLKPPTSYGQIDAKNPCS